MDGRMEFREKLSGVLVAAFEHGDADHNGRSREIF